MHSQLLVILPKETGSVSDKLRELLYPFMEPKIEYFEEQYIKQLVQKYHLNEDNFYKIVSIIETELNITSPVQVMNDGDKVYKIIDKHPAFVPDGWTIGGIWYGLIRNHYLSKDSRPSEEEKQIRDNSLVVSQLDDAYIGNVPNLLLPDGHLICFWDYDYQRAASDFLFTNNTHLMTDLQAAKTKIRKEYADHLAIALDVHT
jgi:hypothetical protein